MICLSQACIFGPKPYLNVMLVCKDIKTLTHYERSSIVYKIIIKLKSISYWFCTVYSGVQKCNNERSENLFFFSTRLYLYHQEYIELGVKILFMKI